MPRGVRTQHTVFDSTMGSGNISSFMAVSPARSAAAATS
jgi:hypothetical protein